MRVEATAPTRYTTTRRPSRNNYQLYGNRPTGTTTVETINRPTGPRGGGDGGELIRSARKNADAAAYTGPIPRIITVRDAGRRNNRDGIFRAAKRRGGVWTRGRPVAVRAR